MSKILNIPSFKNKSGSLSVIEKHIKFSIKRVYYINNIKGVRGGHKHKKTKQFFICLHGKIELTVDNKNERKKIYVLSIPNKGVLLKADDWHSFRPLKKNSIALVLASHKFSKKDYINEK